MECVCNTIGTKNPIGNGEEYMGMIVTIQNRLVHKTHKNKWNDHFRRLEMPAVISPRNTRNTQKGSLTQGSLRVLRTEEVPGPDRLENPIRAFRSSGPRHLRRPLRVRSAFLASPGLSFLCQWNRIHHVASGNSTDFWISDSHSGVVK